MLLTTERLTIRPFVPADWRGLQRIVTDFAASPNHVYDWPIPYDDDGIRQVTDAFASTGLCFAVLLGEQLIGYVTFHDEDGVLDLGYNFLSAFQGQGYAFEACTALMSALPQTHPVKSWTSGTALANTSSVKLLEKLGFHCVGTEFVSFHKDEQGNPIVFEGGMFARTL